MSNKTDLTRQLLDQLPLDERPTFGLAMKTWWQQSGEDGGMRLSPMGLDVFKQLKVTQYEFEFEHVLSPNLLITLHRKLTCPYYLKGGKICRLIMFGSEQAVIYAMYGDLKKFLRYLNKT